MGTPLLTELMTTEELQEFQDAFSDFTGLAALITDEKGSPVTKGSNFTEFCMDLIRKNPEGCKRCEECDKGGALETLKTGKPSVYHCHSGLIDFATPISLDGRMIGSLIGGQALTEEPDRDSIEDVAADLGIDPDALWEASQNVTIMPKEEIDKRADFLVKMGSLLSKMAFSRYSSLKAGKEMETAAEMKTNFLANMSHEIRTPMNAVIGLSEMALRENLPPAARDYINQIKSSGRVLLGIINDILDFSKIEAGKMDILPTDYEPLSIVNDVANMISVKIAEKNIELILDINPSFPAMLEGDNLRIKQVITNIANNAVKFTNKGYVKIIVDFEKVDENTIEFQCAVQDTGIGIKREDQEKLFKSFSQLDPKRNRNIEGTGLGLAICKRLLDLMGGDISFISEYGQGTTFFVSLRNKVIDWSPAVTLNDPKNVFVMTFLKNELLGDQVEKDLNMLGVANKRLNGWNEVEAEINKHKNGRSKKKYIVTEKDCMGPELDDILIKNDDVKCICFEDFMDDLKSSFPNLTISKRPESTIKLAMLLNGSESIFSEQTEAAYEMDFTAPGARILIVDDNPVNLTVAEGLLEPLDMKIFTAVSGKEAIAQIEKNPEKFDLIFMDHMMPDMDGVETTRIIRRLHPSYDDVPIIALTANAVNGAKELFLREGMNDFVAKPIEVRFLVAKVKQWLPQNLLKKKTADHAKSEASDNDSETAVFSADIPEMDFKSAIKMVGSESVLIKILEEYYKNIPDSAKAIKEAFETGDIKQYTILVHALKSSSRQVGAMVLGDMAAELEAAGKEEDLKTIKAKTPYLINKYMSYKKLFEPFLEKKDAASEKGKPKAKDDDIKDLTDKMIVAADILDMDAMEEVMGEFKAYSYPKKEAALIEELEKAVENVDVDGCREICNKLQKARSLH
ncbi:MAG: PocR ligand-binding domain-containing protein [Lachnospiraceae bacterium]|nr:PocR ligand-binding domain-containing protein [Lachnospiraceae bacterium]